MASIFTRIINGEIPCYKIAEDEKHIAFLDINPLAKGHTLCIPKREVDYIFDLEDEEIADLNVFAKKVAKALKANIDCMRVGVVVIGTEVPHAHIHLIPFQSEAQMSFSAPRVQLDSEEMKAIAEKVSQSI